MSLFREHIQKVEAELSQQSNQHNRSDLSEYELMLVRLRDDVLKIKSVKSEEKKNKIKASVLPNYLPWIDGVLTSINASETDNYRQDDVFSQVFVWAVDLLDWSLIEEMFAAMHKAKMTLPERFKRDPIDFMLDQLADSVIDKRQSLPLQHLHNIEDMTCDLDTHNQVRAKFMKAIGILYEAQSDDDIEAAELAAGYFEQALMLNPQSGVKKRMEKMQKMVEKYGSKGEE